ncbi:hypothetical protein BMETH_239_3 [methanotrophic bacterial endosymbiont of Bathymodiolus sp.]|nr:hypothetical protein BMETH_239_3 [methanotrophic bacterial endosymbiont of Bathymodiolus sp.]
MKATSFPTTWLIDKFITIGVVSGNCSVSVYRVSRLCASHVSLNPSRQPCREISISSQGYSISSLFKRAKHW